MSPFYAKDVVDAIALSKSGVFHDFLLPAVVDSYRLAPEVNELLALTRSHYPLTVAPELEEELATAAALESSRRAEADPPGERETAVEDRLGTDLPVYGMLLRRTPRREAMETSRIHRFGSGQLLITPVADYLLVSTPLVDPDLFNAAVAELDGQPST